MNKPLSSDERERIESFLSHTPNIDTLRPFCDIISRLLSAEAFWREAVKNQDALELFDSRTTPPEYRCAFCEEVGTQDTPFHKPDCPWLLAQES